MTTVTALLERWELYRIADANPRQEVFRDSSGGQEALTAPAAPPPPFQPLLRVEVWQRGTLLGCCRLHTEPDADSEPADERSLVKPLLDDLNDVAAPDRNASIDSREALTLGGDRGDGEGGDGSTLNRTPPSHPNSKSNRTKGKGRQVSFHADEVTSAVDPPEVDEDGNLVPVAVARVSEVSSTATSVVPESQSTEPPPSDALNPEPVATETEANAPPAQSMTVEEMPLSPPQSTIRTIHYPKIVGWSVSYPTRLRIPLLVDPTDTEEPLSIRLVPQQQVGKCATSADGQPSAAQIIPAESQRVYLNRMEFESQCIQLMFPKLGWSLKVEARLLSGFAELQKRCIMLRARFTPPPVPPSYLKFHTGETTSSPLATTPIPLPPSTDDDEVYPTSILAHYLWLKFPSTCELMNKLITFATERMIEDQLQQELTEGGGSRLSVGGLALRNTSGGVVAQTDFKDLMDIFTTILECTDIIKMFSMGTEGMEGTGASENLIDPALQLGVRESMISAVFNLQDKYARQLLASDEDAKLIRVLYGELKAEFTAWTATEKPNTAASSSIMTGATTKNSLLFAGGATTATTARSRTTASSSSSNETQPVTGASTLSSDSTSAAAPRSSILGKEMQFRLSTFRAKYNRRERNVTAILSALEQKCSADERGDALDPLTAFSGKLNKCPTTANTQPRSESEGRPSQTCAELTLMESLERFRVGVRLLRGASGQAWVATPTQTPTTGFTSGGTGPASGTPNSSIVAGGPPKPRRSRSRCDPNNAFDLPGDGQQDVGATPDSTTATTPNVLFPSEVDPAGDSAKSPAALSANLSERIRNLVIDSKLRKKIPFTWNPSHIVRRWIAGLSLSPELIPIAAPAIKAVDEFLTQLACDTTDLVILNMAVEEEWLSVLFDAFREMEVCDGMLEDYRCAAAMKQGFAVGLSLRHIHSLLHSIHTLLQKFSTVICLRVPVSQEGRHLKLTATLSSLTAQLDKLISGKAEGTQGITNASFHNFSAQVMSSESLDALLVEETGGDDDDSGDQKHQHLPRNNNSFVGWRNPQTTAYYPQEVVTLVGEAIKEADSLFFGNSKEIKELYQRFIALTTAPLPSPAARGGQDWSAGSFGAPPRSPMGRDALRSSGAGGSRKDPRRKAYGSEGGGGVKNQSFTQSAMTTSMKVFTPGLEVWTMLRMIVSKVSDSVSKPPTTGEFRKALVSRYRELFSTQEDLYVPHRLVSASADHRLLVPHSLLQRAASEWRRRVILLEGPLGCGKSLLLLAIAASQPIGNSNSSTVDTSAAAAAPALGFGVHPPLILPLRSLARHCRSQADDYTLTREDVIKVALEAIHLDVEDCTPDEEARKEKEGSTLTSALFKYEGPLTFLLDGLDEIGSDLVDCPQVRAFVAQACGSIQPHDRIVQVFDTVVVTSREERFFQLTDDSTGKIRPILQRHYTARVSLRPWGESEVKQFLAKAKDADLIGYAEGRLLENALRDSGVMGYLAGLPILCRAVIQACPLVGATITRLEGPHVLFESLLEEAHRKAIKTGLISSKQSYVAMMKKIEDSLLGMSGTPGASGFEKGDKGTDPSGRSPTPTNPMDEWSNVVADYLVPMGLMKTVNCFEFIHSIFEHVIVARHVAKHLSVRKASGNQNASLMSRAVSLEIQHIAATRSRLLFLTHMIKNDVDLCELYSTILSDAFTFIYKAERKTLPSRKSLMDDPSEQKHQVDRFGLSIVAEVVATLLKSGDTHSEVLWSMRKKYLVAFHSPAIFRLLLAPLIQAHSALLFHQTLRIVEDDGLLSPKLSAKEAEYLFEELCDHAQYMDENAVDGILQILKERNFALPLHSIHCNLMLGRLNKARELLQMAYLEERAFGLLGAIDYCFAHWDHEALLDFGLRLIAEARSPRTVTMAASSAWELCLDMEVRSIVRHSVFNRLRGNVSFAGALMESDASMQFIFEEADDHGLQVVQILKGSGAGDPTKQVDPNAALPPTPTGTGTPADQPYLIQLDVLSIERMKHAGVRHLPFETLWRFCQILPKISVRELHLTPGFPFSLKAKMPDGEDRPRCWLALWKAIAESNCQVIVFKDWSWAAGDLNDRSSSSTLSTNQFHSPYNTNSYLCPSSIFDDIPLEILTTKKTIVIDPCLATLQQFDQFYQRTAEELLHLHQSQSKKPAREEGLTQENDENDTEGKPTTTKNTRQSAMASLTSLLCRIQILSLAEDISVRKGYWSDTLAAPPKTGAGSPSRSEADSDGGAKSPTSPVGVSNLPMRWDTGPFGSCRWFFKGKKVKPLKPVLDSKRSHNLSARDLSFNENASVASSNSQYRLTENLTPSANFLKDRARQFGSHSPQPHYYDPAGAFSHFVQSTIAQQNTKVLHYKILLIGDENCGKSCLLKRFVSNAYSDDAPKNLAPIDFAIKDVPLSRTETAVIQFFDIGAQERHGQMSRTYFQDAVGAMIVCDVTRPATIDAAMTWKQELDDLLSPGLGLRSLPCLLVLNKADLGLQGLVSTGRTAADLDTLCSDYNFRYWEVVSAKTGDRVKDIFEGLIEAIVTEFHGEASQFSWTEVNPTPRTNTSVGEPDVGMEVSATRTINPGDEGRASNAQRTTSTAEQEKTNQEGDRCSIM